MTAGELGPVLFAYDGSDLADLAIQEAGRQLAPGRDAVVVTVWRPYGVGFMPPPEVKFDAAASDEVSRAAEATAAQGASIAQAAGFRTQSLAVKEATTWKGIARVADDYGASPIVLGSHGKSGLTGIFLGSVAGAVAAHSGRTVLIVHRRSQTQGGTHGDEARTRSDPGL
jgi:nucleotide-binding universal stress UspA family protein